MKKNVLIYLNLLILGCFTLTVSFAQPSKVSDKITCMPTQEEAVVIDDAKLYIEYNFTDDDIGVHGAFDSGGYSKLCVYDPNGTQLLTVKPLGQLEDLTMGGIFFESREPLSSEFSYEELMADFPEGQYEVRGVTFEGKGLTGSATFSHDVPAAPTIKFPLEDDVVSLNNLVVSWEPVTQTITGDPVTITAYEVIITKEGVEDDPNGFSNPIFDVHVPADRDSLSVSAEFLEPYTEYELEVLALEKSGNQTIGIVFFKTSGEKDTDENSSDSESDENDEDKDYDDEDEKDDEEDNGSDDLDEGEDDDDENDSSTNDEEDNDNEDSESDDLNEGEGDDEDKDEGENDNDDGEDSEDDDLDESNDDEEDNEDSASDDLDEGEYDSENDEGEDNDDEDSESDDLDEGEGDDDYESGKGEDSESTHLDNGGDEGNDGAENIENTDCEEDAEEDAANADCKRNIENGDREGKEDDNGSE